LHLPVACFRELANAERQLEELKSQVATLGQCVAADPQEREESVREFNFYRAAWKNRKDKVKALVDMLAEGMEKSVKETMVRVILAVVCYALLCCVVLCCVVLCCVVLCCVVVSYMLTFDVLLIYEWGCDRLCLGLRQMKTKVCRCPRY
jgi:Flp pilus assembly protein TadB